MSTCTSIDPLVTAYVDGELAAADRAAVDDHLRRCGPCHSRVAAEGAVRDLMRLRKSSLTTERPPAALRAQCREMIGGRSRETGRPAVDRVGGGGGSAWVWYAPWRAGLAPVALTIALMLVVGAAFLYQATHYSARVLAAELAADHVKCFAANSLFGTHHDAATVEGNMMAAFGWELHLPEQFDAPGLELVGSRRCLYAEGKVAHLMYRDRGKPVSIFMLPKRMRPEELVEVLGHEAAIWSSGDRTFVLVTRGSRAEVQRMASFVKAALQ